MNDPRAFYDDLAQLYHLIFEDWDRSMARQGDALASVIERWPGRRKVLSDASCGIGTQAIALALKGFTVVGSDISIGGLRRGRREALTRGVHAASVAAEAPARARHPPKTDRARGGRATLLPSTRTGSSL